MVIGLNEGVTHSAQPRAWHTISSFLKKITYYEYELVVVLEKEVTAITPANPKSYEAHKCKCNESELHSVGQESTCLQPSWP